jgi:hypothetical protein
MIQQIDVSNFCLKFNRKLDPNNQNFKILELIKYMLNMDNYQ